MKRLLLNLLSILSTLLLIVVLVAWVPGARHEFVFSSDGETYATIVSSDGAIEFCRGESPISFDENFKQVMAGGGGIPLLGGLREEQEVLLGLVLVRRSFYPGIFGVRVPLYLLAMVFAILPTLWFASGMRRGRRRGRCESCNYDLRGSPGRCPECGWARE